MLKMRLGLASLLLLSAAIAFAQSGAPPTEATDITKAEIDTVRKGTPNPAGRYDQVIKVVDIGKYNVGVAVIHQPVSGDAAPANAGCGADRRCGQSDGRILRNFGAVKITLPLRSRSGTGPDTNQPRCKPVRVQKVPGKTPPGPAFSALSGPTNLPPPRLDRGHRRAWPRTPPIR